MVKSKTDIIKELAGLRVLDIGGGGYGADNAYEQEISRAWRGVARRTVVDITAGADVRMDLNKLPLAVLDNTWDIAVAFDVLEHVEHPVDVLRWIPATRLIVSVPNAMSPLGRYLEQKWRIDHLMSFTPYTLANMLLRAGWRVTKVYFTLGRWSVACRLANLIGSMCPGRVGTGLVIEAVRA